MIPQNKPNPQPPSSYLSFILQIKSFVLKKIKSDFNPENVPKTQPTVPLYDFACAKQINFDTSLSYPLGCQVVHETGVPYISASPYWHMEDKQIGSLIVRKSLSIRYSDLLNQIKPWEVCTYSLTLIAKKLSFFTPSFISGN